jgi:hypothetical protein
MDGETQIDEVIDRFGLPLSSWDREFKDFEAVEREVRGIMLEHGIQLRCDDGELVQINFSLPTSIPSALVLGLRYRKRDSSLTEDHFACSWRGDRLEVVPYYGRRLEHVFPEYRDTHKAQVDLNAQPPPIPPEGTFTSVNTITFTKVPK